MTRRLLPLHGLALAVSAAAAGAQVAPPADAGVIHGAVLDAGSGRGVPEAWVCARIRVDRAEPVPVCTSADSAGVYRLARLPAGSHAVTVACPAGGSPDLTLAAATVAVPDSATVARDWHVRADRCGRPAGRIAAGSFAGHYAAGFEASLFVPCPADRWPRPGGARSDGPGDPHQAWVVPRDTAVFGAVSWPPLPPADGSGDARWFVRWRGTVEGPGRYGHLGTSAFRLTVDSVLEARLPAAGDCDGPGGRRGRPRA